MGKDRHRHMVAEGRAGFAMLAACFHLGQEGSCALTGLEGSLQPIGRVAVSNESPRCWVLVTWRCTLLSIEVTGMAPGSRHWLRH